tara:strand:+ start:1146 stop:1904 length:759 start_codon:yes stop_codon:yes gene_type:complete
MTGGNNNFIYTGTIVHRRFTPFNHFFNYPLFMAFIDLDTVNSFLKKSWFWNVNKKALIAFHREDYHGKPDTDLSESVRETVYKSIGKEIKGPIRLLTHLRYFGYCFNPVSFYYCYDEMDSEVEVIMAEVTNTPWKERYPYVIHEKYGKSHSLTANFEKKLHVSPFWGMDHEYEWMFTQPGKDLFVNMKNFKSNQKVFDATLKMKRMLFTKRELLKQVFRFPFITSVVVFRIHFQAFKLWIKKAQFFVHPNKI